MANLIPITLLVITFSPKFEMEEYNWFNEKSFDACFFSFNGWESNGQFDSNHFFGHNF
jgi:hypothetical protein